MGWEEYLITLYLRICKEYKENLSFGDQAYKRPDADFIEIEQQLKILTPIKKARGQEKLTSEQRAFSKAVSRMRQPIEAFHRDD